MAKFFFKRILPTREKLNRYRILNPIISRISSAAIWQVNRRSISIAVAIGIFFGAQPVPIQMAMAGITAGLLRVNLPCAILFTFWSNPFTAAPIYYFNYRIGAWLLQSPAHHINADALQDNSLISAGGRILVPLFSGSLLVGMVAAAVSYLVIFYWWRITIMLHKIDRGRRP